MGQARRNKMAGRTNVIDQQVIAATLKRALPDQKRRGNGCPIIITIIMACDSKNVTVLCSKTFAEFEHDALINDDKQSVDEVRSAMAANPGRLIIVMITDAHATVYLAAPLTEVEKAMEKMTTDDSWLDAQTIFYRKGQHGKRQ